MVEPELMGEREPDQEQWVAAGLGFQLAVLQLSKSQLAGFQPSESPLPW